MSASRPASDAVIGRGAATRLPSAVTDGSLASRTPSLPVTIARRWSWVTPSAVIASGVDASNVADPLRQSSLPHSGHYSPDHPQGFRGYSNRLGRRRPLRRPQSEMLNQTDSCNVEAFQQIGGQNRKDCDNTRKERCRPSGDEWRKICGGQRMLSCG